MAISPVDYLAQQNIEQARSFLGRRRELHRLVQENMMPQGVLEAHTNLMVENRNTIKGFLWRVLDKETGHTVDLVGTVHSRIYVRNADFPMMPQGFSMPAINAWNQKKEQWLLSIVHPEIGRSLAQARKVYFEVDPLSSDYQMLQMTRLNDFAAAHPEVVNHKPKQEAAPFVQKAADQLDMGTGMDIVLAHSLKGQGKVASLEPFDRHITSIENAMQVAFNESNHFSYNPESQLQSLDAGSWGNFEGVEAMNPLYPQALRDDWDERTEKYMIPQIKRSLREGTNDTFVVGAGHYCGDRSILAALSIADADYEITRIPLD